MWNNLQFTDGDSILDGPVQGVWGPLGEQVINSEALINALRTFKSAEPFDHCVIDDFFSVDTARALDREFLGYDSEKWYFYNNQIENKKALNDWNAFPALTYRVFSYLNSREFIEKLESYVGVPLHADNGLHGGGWHMHASGGNLNPHLDYSIHPKMALQRRLNIIIYLSEDLRPEHGGYLGLWAHDNEGEKPGKLIKEVEPKFNRAILFDTTQNSWHGMSRPLVQPDGIYRKSFAVYYMCEPVGDVDPRGRALFAPRVDQIGDAEVERVIKLRSDVKSSAQVYRTTE
ncbi:2OG-Fe(II) oxygenase [Paraburkholderia oxyphila]|uniref:2OG-Fe(II) oxygenase n=1 Tax=Paraburkholderia oxyphila TaxID=614212 RepID=UPI001FDF537F|nr:2OG-Fe(II) oxygenase [Paraburkholderia oxyphila]